MNVFKRILSDKSEKNKLNFKIDNLKGDKIIALAGNPNVGKSTVFNELTGLKQHTGNWPGKTVSNARGKYSYKGKDFILVDLPGTYSLLSNSSEEEIARDYICFGNADATVVVVDATCIERNLNLVLQIIEITQNVIVCVNILDEAEKKGIVIDLDELSLQLGVPVVGMSARSKKGLSSFMETVYHIAYNKRKTYRVKLEYQPEVEQVLKELEPLVLEKVKNQINARWVSVKLLDIDEKLNHSLTEFVGCNLLEDKKISEILNSFHETLLQKGIEKENLKDGLVSSVVKKAEDIYNKSVHLKNKNYNERDRKIDKLLTSKLTGIPIMIALLFLIFWLTMVGANYPSEVIANVLFALQDKLTELFSLVNAPAWLHGLLILGLYRTAAWVISVMLPPMAIFSRYLRCLKTSGTCHG